MIRALAARDLTVTASQLESWRRTGLLPRRRGLGRGRGSVVDAVDPLVVESAAALARHLRQGRDRRLAVLEWFAEAGTPTAAPGAIPVPEPPVAAVREALVWVLQRSASQQLVEFARSAAGAGEEGQDTLYAAAGRLMGPYRGAAHPAQVRSALEAGGAVPAEAQGPDFRSMVHVAAAIGLGAQEVGADARWPKRSPRSACSG
ncbi:hypothetical protein [Streptomyces pseudogriseolus]|uniref:hypothetical protein n=1 Tax=Streptomyces pseudogriseolus TaxID=36817 RepID=UPI003FA1AC6C